MYRMIYVLNSLPQNVPNNSDFQQPVRKCTVTFRFSIAWSRIIPDGIGELNPLGVQYYKNLIA